MESPQVNRTPSANIHVLIYCLLPLLIIIILLTSSQTWLKGINSDLLYTVSLYKDLFVDNYSVVSWNLTPAPYFFPDMFLFFPLLWSVPDIGYAFVLYSIIFFILCLVILTKIASFLNKSGFNCFLCIFSAGLLFVALMQDINYAPLSILFFFPSLHSGAILVGLTLMAITMSAMQKGYSYVSAILFFSLSFLTIISDIIIIPQFLLPLAITTFIFYRLRFIPARTFLITAGLIVVAHLAASVLLKVLAAMGIFNNHLESIATAPNLGSFVNTFHNFLRDMNYYLNANSNLFVIFAIFVLTSIIVLGKNWGLFFSNDRQNRNFTSNYVLVFLIIFSLVSITITTAAPIVTGDWVDLTIFRHIQPTYIFPIFIIALILAASNDRRVFWFKVTVFSTIVIFSLDQIIPGAITLKAANLRLPYPEMIQCLDRLATNYDLQYGYSSYWNAKYTTVLSHSRLRVNQLQSNLDIYNWINNPAWYSNKVGESNGQYPKYQFILNEGLSKAEIEAKFGKPSVRKQCPGTEMYIYNRKSDVAFRNFLRIPAIIADRREVSSSILTPKSLSQYVSNGTPWDAPGNVTIPKNGELTVQFNPPVVNEILEIAADSSDDYVVNFFMDQTRLGQLPVPRTPGSGIQTRYLPLPKSVMRKPFNRLVVQPLQGDGAYSVGHIFFYNDSF